MGVTINSKNHSIDLGYHGFFRLRTKVAELADTELGEHFKKIETAPFLDGREEFFKEYDKKIVEIVNKNKIPHAIPDFVYQSDGEGEINPEQCTEIYEIIKDYDDNILYGYSGREDCAMFKDFKEIIKDCIDNNCNMSWC